MKPYRYLAFWGKYPSKYKWLAYFHSKNTKGNFNDITFSEKQLEKKQVVYKEGKAAKITDFDGKA